MAFLHLGSRYPKYALTQATIKLGIPIPKPMLTAILSERLNPLLLLAAAKDGNGEMLVLEGLLAVMLDEELEIGEELEPIMSDVEEELD